MIHGRLLSGMSSGRDARGGGGQGGGEGLKDRRGRLPGASRAAMKRSGRTRTPANVVALRPVGEGRIMAADRQGLRRSSPGRR